MHDRLIKLHIGAGKRYLPGYKQVDVLDKPHIDYVADARSLFFAKNGSVSEIYACHVLEHFGRYDVCDVLREWHRVLCAYGTLRISVPDFSAIVFEYQQHKELDLVLGLLYGGQDHEHNFHYQVFDFKRLERLLTGVGFTNVMEYDWRDFLPEGFDDFSRAYLPHMDMENGRLMSLNVRCTKKEA